MRLTELARYAKEKYGIEEERLWAQYPGFSVLKSPVTGKWVALLMRRWDPVFGEERELCDIKCGNDGTDGFVLRHPPYRMRGEDWFGIDLDSIGDSEAVFIALDRALEYEAEDRFTIVIGGGKKPASAYRDTPIKSAPEREPGGRRATNRIRKMLKLSMNGADRNRLFYIQGKFMEDYEDDYLYVGSYFGYYPTYHDLSVDQLRGYFTWRTKLRHGKWEATSTSFVYIYLYELLNGIGTASPEESLDKLEEFEQNYFNVGDADPLMRMNIRRWKYEFSIVNGMPLETVLKYADARVAEWDNALAVLREPSERTDGEVYDSLVYINRGKLKNSAVVKKFEGRGISLFASLWRETLNKYRDGRKTIFTAVFGRVRKTVWRPLGNAVYWDRPPLDGTVRSLNPIHSYGFLGGVWHEKSYLYNSFDKKLFDSFLRAGDRLFRRYLNTGHPLSERPEEGWAEEYAKAVIAEDRRRIAEASRPNISICFDRLDRIRRDASETRESLLTEDELDLEGEEIDDIEAETTLDPPLTKDQEDALKVLIAGGDILGLLRKKNVMPEVFADSVNEALFDEIGDSVLFCGGRDIEIVEDYREDLVRLLGGRKNG